MLAPVRKGDAVADTPCPHCGELHAAAATSCPNLPTSGGPLPAPAEDLPAPEAAAPASAAPDRGVADLLLEAWSLYRRHARFLLLTCAVLFVPASIIKSCAVSAIMGPALSAGAAMTTAMSAPAPDLDAANAALQDAYQSHANAATIDRLRADQARVQAEVARRSLLAAGSAMGGFATFVLGLLGTLVTFFIYGVTVPLTNGALTIAAGDRLLGGSASWSEVWTLLFRRLIPLLTAVVPAAFITAFGFLCLYVPGLVFALLFSFVAPVVLIEGLRGRAALQRSVQLVLSDWLRVALMIAVLAVLRWLADLVAHIVLPQSAVFLSSLFGDLVMLLFLPLPVLGMVLLYFDVRRKRDGFTDDRLRADLEALKTA
jgi:hypothetical protein